jgi:hypothetical protein
VTEGVAVAVEVSGGVIDGAAEGVVVGDGVIVGVLALTSLIDLATNSPCAVVSA